MSADSDNLRNRPHETGSNRPLIVAATEMRLPAWAPPLFYLLLAMIFLWRPLFTSELFLPAGLLGHIAPWSHSITGDLPPWNPLRWDGIAQFYPWRHFAAETLREGYIPLWNPYQFCGTPFVANSQSAVFYPLNLLFYLLPLGKAFGISACLHLALAGWFTYLLARRLHCSEIPALLSGVVFAFSAWQISWLQLPSFLATSCWIPLLLLQVHRLTDLEQIRTSGIRLMAGAGAVTGLMLLAGHLQIAFYGILVAALFFGYRVISERLWKQLPSCTKSLFLSAGALALGLMLCLPQLLPSLELSRVSHRTGKPSSEGFHLYSEYALPLRGLATAALPDLFGNDKDPANPYWGFYVKQVPDTSGLAIRHNAAETALYTGSLPLLQALFAVLIPLIRRFSKRDEPPTPGISTDPALLFFAGLALLVLLMALGTPLNAIFYFLIPGFGQSGSPARCLVLWTLAVSILSGFGMNRLLREPPTPRELGFTLALFILIIAIGLSATASSLTAGYVGLDRLKAPALGDAFSRIGSDWIVLLISLIFIGLPMLPAARRELRPGLSGFAPLFLIWPVCELFIWGIGINPTAKTEQVYPRTPGIKQVQALIGHDRVLPINQRWSLNEPPPAVFPPNAGMVYGFRDVQGYDSLLTGQYKAFATGYARPNRMGVRDASPMEVGNMIFFQDARTPDLALPGVRVVLSVPTDSPGYAGEAVPAAVPLPDQGDMLVYGIPDNSRIRLRTADGRVLNQQALYLNWLTDGATRVHFTIKAPESGTLEIADQYYPGWKATVNGAPVTLSRSATAPVFRAISVISGEQRIELTYQPTSFRLGLYLSLLSTLFILTLSLWPTSQSPKNEKASAQII